MSRITPLPDGDAATARAVDDLVITEFGHDPAEFPDGRICICWTSSPGVPSATDGGHTSR
ncbi:hypothetical protein [Streptomyces griseoruber]|uniref:Uncharacterized protein n=1 Tax=Streptomyces griseoruber TaxID=1943 RepID=A0A101T3F4_9ACTN|nr:hypothetical protein [Streptomyces griseoruber]KUN85029.1 hypothetical protein AQJ64_12405 [Streptomyces griseoruber]